MTTIKDHIDKCNHSDGVALLQDIVREVEAQWPTTAFWVYDIGLDRKSGELAFDIDNYTLDDGPGMSVSIRNTTPFGDSFVYLRGTYDDGDGGGPRRIPPYGDNIPETAEGMRIRAVGISSDVEGNSASEIESMPDNQIAWGRLILRFTGDFGSSTICTMEYIVFTVAPAREWRENDGIEVKMKINFSAELDPDLVHRIRTLGVRVRDSRNEEFNTQMQELFDSWR